MAASPASTSATTVGVSMAPYPTGRAPAAEAGPPGGVTVWGGPPPCCRDRLLIACDRCQDAFRLVRFWWAALVCRCSRTTSSTTSRRGSAGCSQQRQAHHDGASHTCGGDPVHGVHTRKPCSLTRGDSGTTPRYFGMQYKATGGKEVLTHRMSQHRDITRPTTHTPA